MHSLLYLIQKYLSIIYTLAPFNRSFLLFKAINIRLYTSEYINKQSIVRSLFIRSSISLYPLVHIHSLARSYSLTRSYIHSYIYIGAVYILYAFNLSTRSYTFTRSYIFKSFLSFIIKGF